MFEGIKEQKFVTQTDSWEFDWSISWERKISVSRDNGIKVRKIQGFQGYGLESNILFHIRV